MEAEENWQGLVRKLEALLHLRTFPVAMKLLEDAGELAQYKWARRPPEKLTLCQMISIVRYADWTVGATADDLLFNCGSIVGMADLPEQVKDGTFRSLVWCKTKEDGKKCEDSIPRIPRRFEAIVLAPLVYDPFEPDVVLIYGNPAQMILLINAIQFEDYERLQFFCVGESSCSDAIAQCYLTGKPSLTIPCFGERRYAGVQDDEMVMALPPQTVGKVERGLEELYKRGVCYPIPPLGAQCNAATAMPPGYQQLMKGEKIEGLGMPLRKSTRW